MAGLSQLLACFFRLLALADAIAAFGTACGKTHHNSVPKFLISHGQGELKNGVWKPHGLDTRGVDLRGKELHTNRCGGLVNTRRQGRIYFLERRFGTTMSPAVH